MAVFRLLLLACVLVLPHGIAAANNDDGLKNNDDGFIWIDANTRIKVKPVSTTAGSGATAPEKAPETAPETAPKKDEKKEKDKK